MLSRVQLRAARWSAKSLVLSRCGLSMLRICSSSFDGLDYIPFALQRKSEQAGRSYGRSVAIGKKVYPSVQLGMGAELEQLAALLLSD